MILRLLTPKITSRPTFSTFTPHPESRTFHRFENHLIEAYLLSLPKIKPKNNSGLHRSSWNMPTSIASRSRMKGGMIVHAHSKRCVRNELGILESHWDQLEDALFDVPSTVSSLASSVSSWLSPAASRSGDPGPPESALPYWDEWQEKSRAFEHVCELASVKDSSEAEDLPDLQLRYQSRVISKKNEHRQGWTCLPETPKMLDCEQNSNGCEMEGSGRAHAASHTHKQVMIPTRYSVPFG